ncbi:MAG TPA: hypothetical protein PKK10_03650 [Woeseiaceae bacterium]|nr:hypothetical protein [Woeseiaceae bacterium]
MKQINWREIVEIVGAVSIVAALLLVALELRDGNRITRHIAETDTQFALLENYARLQSAQMSNPEYARLFAKVSTPKGQLITATEQSQMQAIARQTLTFYRSAQIAADLGFLSDEQLTMYSNDLRNTLHHYPGLHEAFIDAYEELGDMQEKAVFASLADIAKGQAPKPAAP